MTWTVTQRDLPGWGERPWWSCFPDASSQWQPEEQYEYAEERYYTENVAPGAWACGYWAATFRTTRQAAGVAEGYSGVAAERDRIAEQFDTTVERAIELSTDPAEREYLERIQRESVGPRDPGYQQGREAGEWIAEKERDLGEWWARVRPWLIAGALAAGVVGVFYVARKAR